MNNGFVRAWLGFSVYRHDRDGGCDRVGWLDDCFCFCLWEGMGMVMGWDGMGWDGLGWDGMGVGRGVCVLG